MQKTVLLVDMWIHTRHKEDAGIYISGIERVCTEEILYAIRSGLFDIFLLSSRQKEEYLSVLQKNIPEFSRCKILHIPPTSLPGKVLRMPVSLFSRLMQKWDWGCRHILTRCLPLIIKSWTLGEKKLSKLPELKGRKIIYYSCFRAYHPAVLQDKNIIKTATVHDIIPLRYFRFSGSEYYGYLIDFFILSKYSDFLFFMSEFTRKDFLDFFPETSVENIVNYGAASNRFYPRSPEEIVAVKKKYNIPESKKYILSVAASGKRKNMQLLLRIFLKMRDIYPIDNIQLVLTGKFYTEDCKLQKLIEKNSDTVTMTGFVEDDDLPALYSGASCYCFLSDYEGFGLPLLEAFQTDCPVVCSDKTCLPEISGAAAITIPPEDENALMTAIFNICSDDKLAGKLKSKGICRAGDFSWAKHGENFVTSLENL